MRAEMCLCDDDDEFLCDDSGSDASSLPRKSSHGRGHGPWNYDDDLNESYRPSCGSRLFERIMLRENYVEVAGLITNAMEELYDKYNEKGAQASMDDETVRKQLEYSIYNLVSRFRGINRNGKGDIFYDNQNAQDTHDEDATLSYEHAQEDMMKQNDGHIPHELTPAVNIQGFVYYLTKVLGKNENTKVRTIAKYFEVPENRSRLVSQINNVLHHKRDPKAYGYKAVDWGTTKEVPNKKILPNNRRAASL